MVKFIKAYSGGPNTIFEVKVTAVNETLAKSRGTIWLFGKTPTGLTSLESVTVDEMPGNGIVREYRVIAEVAGDESLRDMLKVDEVVDAIEDIL